MSSVYERKIKVRLKKSLIFNCLKFFYEQRPDGVQHRDDHYSNVREDRQPHVGKAQSSQGEAKQLHTDGKNNILVYDPQTFP